MNNSYDQNEQNTAQGQEPPFFYDPNAPLSVNRPEPVGFSVASMVLGIFAILCCCIAPVGLAISVLGLLFAILSYRQLHRFNGMALAGLIMSILALVLAGYSIIDGILNPVSPEDLDAIMKMYEELLNQQGGLPSAIRFLFY